MHTFITKFVTWSDKYRAILLIVFHFPFPFPFPLPEEGAPLDFRVFFFSELLFEGLVITSKLHIISCNFGTQELEPTPSSTKEWRKLSLISPIDTDSIGPCTCHKLTEYIATGNYETWTNMEVIRTKTENLN